MLYVSKDTRARICLHVRLLHFDVRTCTKQDDLGQQTSTFIVIKQCNSVSWLLPFQKIEHYCSNHVEYQEARTVCSFIIPC